MKASSIKGNKSFIKAKSGHKPMDYSNYWINKYK